MLVHFDRQQCLGVAVGLRMVLKTSRICQGLHVVYQVCTSYLSRNVLIIPILCSLQYITGAGEHITKTLLARECYSYHQSR